MNMDIEKSRIGEINRLHQENFNLYMQSLERGIRIGELLQQQKKSMDHGSWLPWVDENLPFTERTARRYLEVYRHRERLKRTLVSDLNTAYKLLAEPKEEKVEKEIAEYIKNAPEYQPSEDIQIYHGDFREVCESIPEESIDHILTDPPYEDDSIPLWSDLSEVAEKVLKPSGFCITYAGKLRILEEMNRLSEHLEYYWIINLIHLTRTKVFPRLIYDLWRPVLIFSKPPIKTQDNFAFDTVQPIPREKDLHPWQQCKGESIELLERFTKPGELILDPFGGSGTVAEACREIGRRCITIEKEAKYVEVIKSRMAYSA